jgi:uncharacterized membrane protein YphA (DoxX/SURF4 family)
MKLPRAPFRQRHCDTGVAPVLALDGSGEINDMQTSGAFGTGGTPVSREAVSLARVLTRTALGVIWVYEGLVPKLLFATQHEIDLVARSHAYWPTPYATLATLGACEILGGLWLLSGKSEKTAALLSFALVAALGPVCAVLEPSIFYHPFGGLSKDLALLACAAVVWLLSPAALAKPRSLYSDNKTGGERMASGGSDNPSLCAAEPSAAARAATRRPGSQIHRFFETPTLKK